MKTDKQIESEILALKALEGKLPNSIFGDDNNAALAEQINVLQFRMSEDTIWGNWPDAEDEGAWDDDEHQHVRDAALEAYAWMTTDQPGSMADEWRVLIR